MSGGSSTNSWTILGSEEPVPETLRPLAEGTSTTGLTGNTQSADAAASPEGPPVEDHPVSKKEELNEDSGSAHCTDAPVHSPHVSGGASEGAADTASETSSRRTPSPLEPSLASAETAGGPEPPENDGRPTHEATLQHAEGEGEGPDLSPRIPDPESSEDVGAGEERTEDSGAEGEPGVRRRRRSLLATLEQIGRRDEEEEGEEEFQLPQREDDGVFTLNKCILGAVILLGLGTIFFSGVFMDLEEEADYGTRELKDSGVAGKQEWLHPEAPPPPVDVDSSELLSKISEGKEQILMLQAQLQAQNEELKVAKGQAADGASERLRWQEEHSRLKKEVASLPLLQKENERMRRELQSVPALKKELETLRSTVTQMKQPSVGVASSSPPGGRPGDSRQPSPDSPGPEKVKERKEKYDKGEKDWKESKKPERKEGEKKERKDGRTEWQEEKKKKWKDGEDKLEGKQKSHGDDKRWKEKEKVSRGDEGKQWKDREEKERKERSERKEWKDEGERKKYERRNEGTGWRGKEERNDRRGGKDHKEEWKKVKEGNREGDREQWRKGEKEDEWRQGGSKEEGKGKEERKHKKRSEWREKNGGEDEWRRREEKKQWRENGGEDEWRRKEEKKQWRENGGEDEWRRKEEEKQWRENGGEDEWRRKEEKKQWRENGEEDERRRKEEKKQWRDKNGGEDERRRKEEKKQWRENGEEDEWRRKEEKKQWRDKNGGEDEWRRKGERKHWEKKHGDTSVLQTEKDEHRLTSHRHGDKHLWGDRKPPHTHLTPDQPEYWSRQRTRLQRGPPQRCGSLEACARAEGLLPVPLPDFHSLLQTYLDKAEQGGAAVAPAQREELGNLVTEFFKDGVFVHERMNFQEFTEDVGDILEDLVEGEGEEGEGEGEESAVEKEMEGFEREVMKTFAAPGEKKERMKGEWRESGGARGG